MSSLQFQDISFLGNINIFPHQIVYKTTGMGFSSLSFSPISAVTSTDHTGQHDQRSSPYTGGKGSLTHQVHAEHIAVTGEKYVAGHDGGEELRCIHVVNTAIYYKKYFHNHMTKSHDWLAQPHSTPCPQ